MSEEVQARVSESLNAPAERVFDAWLDPGSVRLWMAAALRAAGLAGDLQRVEIDARVGGRFLFSDQRGDVEARHWGTYLTLERPRRLVFTWITDESQEADPSTVELTIEPTGDGCKATLVHHMDPQWADFVARVEASWSRMLQQVGKRVESGN